MHLANVLFPCRKDSIHFWQSLKRTVLPLIQNLLYVTAAIFSYCGNHLGDVHMSRLMYICFFGDRWVFFAYCILKWKKVKTGSVPSLVKCIDAYCLSIARYCLGLSVRTRSVYSRICKPSKEQLWNSFEGKDLYLLMGWSISNIRIWYMALRLMFLCTKAYRSPWV